VSTSRILWVDLRVQQDKPGLYRYLAERWPVCRANDGGRLVEKVAQLTPVLLCFEYDYPDTPGLTLLQQVRQRFPSIPVIMVTEQHSEALAVWALRNRLWDYLVKPFSHQELLTSAESSISSKQAGQAQAIGRLPSPVPVELRLNANPRKSTLAACSFVEKHCHEKIAEKEVASLCGMNTSTFSRIFKKEHGMTFRDYLVQYRIRKAQQLLHNPNASVQDIAYTVGFRDPSYFTRMFRRLVGMSPSRYKEHCRNQTEKPSPSPGRQRDAFAKAKARTRFVPSTVQAYGKKGATVHCSPQTMEKNHR